MTTRFCPDCGAEYLADVDECADCLVPLVGGGVSTDNDGGDEVVYELDDWEPELLEELAQALARNAIPYSWEDNRNLVVRERDSDRVDDLARTDATLAEMFSPETISLIKERVDQQVPPIVHHLADIAASKNTRQRIGEGRARMRW